MEITSKTLKAYKEFLGYKNKIDYELKEKGLYGIDILLMSYSVHDTIDFLQENSETFRILTITDNSKIDEFYKYFISLKNRYQQEINLPDRQSLLLLISKSKQNSKIVFPKNNISFVNTENREEYINRIIRRLKDCVNLYYSAYYNQEIYAELSNGEYTYLKFLEENLPHILGINKNQILMNSEAKRVLNIPQTEMPDIIVSKNGFYHHKEKRNTTSSIAILEKIIADLETNQDIVNAYFDAIVKQESKEKGMLSKEQFAKKTSTQLLPFDKIDLKTRAFMSDTPYTKVSTIVPLAPGEKLTTKNDRASQVKISKSSLTSIDNSKTVLLENGKIKLERGSDYVFTGYVPHSRQEGNVPVSLIVAENESIGMYAKKFIGQKPHNIVSINNPKNGSNTIFSPQEQFEMYLSLLTDFNGGMDLNDLYQELIQFANSYEARVAEQMNNKGKNK